MLPGVLAWLAEPIGPATDNLARAERLGWVESAAEWLAARQLRNFMIHEDVRDMSVPANALQKGHQAVPLLAGTAKTMAELVLSQPLNLPSTSPS